ncbi:MAG: hypothetical protein FWC56_00700 [Phycisphaerae bacterium]|nr:hypothetical protein [Phycisphaerae bacterium]
MMRQNVTRWSAAILLLSSSAVLLTGCQMPQEPTSPTQAHVEVSSPEALESLWKSADKTLRDYAFEPDRQDRAEGVIVTRPETAAAWFEFWRPQPTPAYTWWESNLHPIRQQVTVTIQPVAADPTADSAVASEASAMVSGYQVMVVVDTYRYSLTERQIDNPAAALRMFSHLAPTETGRRERQSVAGRWLPLGRDGALEEAILQRILKHYGRSNNKVVAQSSSSVG